MWSSTRIVWDQQILLIWILLPPIFIVCGLLALAAPYLVRKKDVNGAPRERFIPEQAVAADQRS